MRLHTLPKPLLSVSVQIGGPPRQGPVRWGGVCEAMIALANDYADRDNWDVVRTITWNLVDSLTVEQL